MYQKLMCRHCICRRKSYKWYTKIGCCFNWIMPFACSRSLAVAAHSLSYQSISIPSQWIFAHCNWRRQQQQRFSSRFMNYERIANSHVYVDIFMDVAIGDAWILLAHSHDVCSLLFCKQRLVPFFRVERELKRNQ